MLGLLRMANNTSCYLLEKETKLFKTTALLQEILMLEEPLSGSWVHRVHPVPTFPPILSVCYAIGGSRNGRFLPRAQ